MDGAKDACLRWLDCNSPRLVVPMHKCSARGQKAKEGGNESCTFEQVEKGGASFEKHGSAYQARLSRSRSAIEKGAAADADRETASFYRAAMTRQSG